MKDIDDDLEIGLEKSLYTPFRREHLTFRMGHVGNRFLRRDVDTLQLPVGSVLHTVDQLVTETPSLFPDMDNPFIRNEELLVYMDSLLDLPKDDSPFAIPSGLRHRFVGAMYRSKVLRFMKTQKDIRRMVDREAVLGRKRILSVINCNPLLQVTTYGKMKNYTRFEITLRGILDSIARIDRDFPEKLHFLDVPVTTDVYTKIRYMKGFKEITPITVKKGDDPGFFFLVHLLGFLTEAPTSLFSKLDRNLRDRLHVCLHAGPWMIMFSLEEMKALQEKSDLFYMRLLRYVHAMKLKAANLLAEEADDETIDAVIQEQEVSEVPEITIAAPMVEEAEEVPETDPVLPEEDRVDTEETLVPTARLAREVETAIQTSPSELSALQKSRASEAADRVRTLSLGDATFGELLDGQTGQEIVDATVSSLEDTLPDASMAKSRIDDFDSAYIATQMDRDMAAVFASLSSAGMILSHVEHRDEIDKFNRIRHYRLRYQDLTGKKHTVNFRIPLIGPEGDMYTNGIKSRLIKQQINTPICKTSAYRVNLASNFNKTLVERTRLQAKRFDVFLARHIGKLVHGGQMTARYGSYEPKVKLPFDYTAIAGKYAALSWKDWDLVFDFPNRFGEEGSTEAFRETKDVFTHADALYDLKALKTDMKKKAVEETDIRPLLWILQFDQPKSVERMMRTDTENPLIVLKEKDRLVVVDGLHRLAKAQNEGKRTMPVRFLSPEELETYRLSWDRQMAILKDSDLQETESFLRSVYIGRKGKLPVFWGLDNVIRVIDRRSDDVIVLHQTIREILDSEFDLPLPSVTPEWVGLKLQDKTLPVVLSLAFRFGLTRILTELAHPFRFVEEGTRVQASVDDIVIPFSDGKLVFPRYPLKTSLILAGLAAFDLKSISFADMNLADTYFVILENHEIKVNYLKGIKDFFTYFVDPITRDVLESLGEPVTPKGLLLRAAEMLSTEEHLPASSLRHHRIRGYERIPALVYNTLSRTLARADAHRAVETRSFSINPEEIFYKLIQDPTFQAVETLNPVHDVKTKTLVTHMGQGGRSGNHSIVTEDRIFSEDALGSISEATPDSGKVAVNVHTSMDPSLRNLRGLYQSRPPEDLEPTNILSVSSLLMPGALQDDSKRIGYISKELSHGMPVETGESMRVRTGYESVLAHRCSDHFAVTAKRNGVVKSVDEELGLVTVTYDRETPKPDRSLKSSLSRGKISSAWRDGEDLTLGLKHSAKWIAGDVIALGPDKTLFRVAEILPFESAEDLPSTDMAKKDIQALSSKVMHVRLTPLRNEAETDVFRIGDIITEAAGLHVQQRLVLNGVKAGDRFQAEDVLAYNPGFFEPGEGKQVDWKHGTPATVAFMDRSETYEDACQISKAFAEKLRTTPAHVRHIEMTRRTVVHDHVKIGRHVETTDHLVILEDEELDAIQSVDNEDTLELLASLNRKMPRARHHGQVVAIDVHYACDLGDLHPSLQKLARVANARTRKIHEAHEGTLKDGTAPPPSKIPVGTRYRNMEFLDTDKVVISFTITEDAGMGLGDKLVLSSAAKSVVSAISEEQFRTESGKDIDVVFSSSGVSDRLLSSWLVQGMGEVILEGLEDQVVSDYFGEGS